MVTDEFEHYFRLCIPRVISSEEARLYLFAVDDHADVAPDDKDVVMVYHEDEGMHCYDVRLSTDVTAEQGDDIMYGLDEIFPEDDFECESSMSPVEEQTYLMHAGMRQLSE